MFSSVCAYFWSVLGHEASLQTSNDPKLHNWLFTSKESEPQYKEKAKSKDHQYMRENVKQLHIYVLKIFLSDPSPIIGNACHSLPNWLTNSLTHSNDDAV